MSDGKIIRVPTFDDISVVVNPSMAGGLMQLFELNVNSDGKTDHFVRKVQETNQGGTTVISDSVTIYKNNGNGSFIEISTIELPTSARFVIPVDVDGDGDDDLVTISTDKKGNFSYHQIVNNGTTFSIPQTISINQGATALKQSKEIGLRIPNQHTMTLGDDKTTITNLSNLPALQISILQFYVLIKQFVQMQPGQEAQDIKQAMDELILILINGRFYVGDIGEIVSATNGVDNVIFHKKFFLNNQTLNPSNFFEFLAASFHEASGHIAKGKNDPEAAGIGLQLMNWIGQFVPLTSPLLNDFKKGKNLALYSWYSYHNLLARVKEETLSPAGDPQQVANNLIGQHLPPIQNPGPITIKIENIQVNLDTKESKFDVKLTFDGVEVTYLVGE
ncbi:MAG: VCBS repeat-containing protein [Planctomycetes bacterium]|nr:VCBS repeat-containing protein [Planctomycetota bacterium]